MTRARAVLVAFLTAASLAIGIVIVARPNAAPYANCNRPVYSGTARATVRCDAASTASTARVRLWVRCWAGPFVSNSRYTAWVTIPAGATHTLLFTSHGWCPSPGQWTVDPELRA